MAYVLTSMALLIVLASFLVVRWYACKRKIKQLGMALDTSLQDLEHLQLAFNRFAPQSVIEDIIAKGLSTSAERCDVTILFADLVNFTGISEHLPPEQLVQMLNGYFREMNRVIKEHRGHVSKFIGDGLLALFGVPEPNPWQTPDAVNAALAMRRALHTYNGKLAEQGFPQLQFGIGIHYGQVVAGVIGSQDLLEYTVIGDIVNTASRIETLTRKFGVDILISAEAVSRIDGRFELTEMPEEEVKGKQTKVSTYTLNSALQMHG
jgi:adenylate cyclase